MNMSATLRGRVSAVPVEPVVADCVPGKDPIAAPLTLDDVIVGAV